MNNPSDESNGLTEADKPPKPSAASVATPGGAAGDSFFLVPGTRPVADFELVQLLGRGGFGEVWKANGPGGFAVAMKFIRLEERCSQFEVRSLEVMKDIRHPHLLGMFGAWQRDNWLITAMELADRTLMDRWKECVRDGNGNGIPADELIEYMREAAKGIDYLNNLGIQHRDIKPQNLLLAGGGVKVADFGLAKVLENTSASNTGAMTPGYAAPEFLNRQTSNMSDQYALAVSYCLLRGGRLPFEGTSAQVMTGHLMHAPDLTMLPEPEQPAIARALAKKPEERWPSCRAFVDALAARTADSDQAGRALPASALALAPTEVAAHDTSKKAASQPAPSAPRRRPLVAFALFGVVLMTAAGVVVVGNGWLKEKGQASASSDGTQATPSAEPTNAPVPKNVEPETKSPSLTLAKLQPVRLAAGKRTVVDWKVERQNSSDPVEFEVLEPNDKRLLVKLGMLAADQNVARLELTAASDAGDTVQHVRIRAKLGMVQSIGEVIVTTHPSPRIHLAPIEPVTLVPGQSVKLPVRLKREHYNEPIELAVEGLPAGVQAKAGPMAVDSDEGVVELTVAADAPAKEQSARLVARAVDVPQQQQALRLTVLAKTITNTLGIKLVLIPAGTFRMGSPPEEPGREKDEVQHDVTSTRPFYLGAYEVTFGQFAAFVKETGYQTDVERHGKGLLVFNPKSRRLNEPVTGSQYNWRNPGWKQTNDHPVTMVSWQDAVGFCRWLSQKHKRIYRLPTEAEWEYACRAGTTTRFSSGAKEDDLGKVANAADAALKPELPGQLTEDRKPEPWNDRYPYTAPVGKFKPNAWGLYDMHGNVLEWCADWYDDTAYTRGPRTDPKVLERRNQEDDGRVLRGGSWAMNGSRCRAAYRHYYDPQNLPNNENGFRVVLELPEKGP